jgi:hypothetical protein
MAAHKIINDAEDLSWEDMAEMAELVLVTFPRVLNRFRDISSHYDVLEAYKLLKANNCLPDIYQFTEELPYSHAVLSEMGQTVLSDAVKAMASQELNIGLYTCEPLMLLIGSYKSSIFILDTHPVPVSVGGHSTGILKIFSGSAIEVSEACCTWLKQRIQSCGRCNENPQSLAMIEKESINRFNSFPYL